MLGFGFRTPLDMDSHKNLLANGLCNPGFDATPSQQRHRSRTVVVGA